ncbi:baseplate J/gp47 family protein [Cohnella sp. GCM10027633]|uniref:baseplate J/gp47 family protein n=1 Tax=unclassified Cohnella TaxID=2636738 RepID=UPI003641C245
MYEGQSYSVILERMLDRIPDTVDKREGSVIYDALAPAAWEMNRLYAELDTALNLAFGDTSSGGFLDLRASDRGVTRRAATRSKRLGLFFSEGEAPFDVPIGSRYGIAGDYYIVTERLGFGSFELEAEAAGEGGNQRFGALLPLDYVPGLVRAELADVLVPGADTETDEELRARYLLAVRQPATSGNASHYKQWASEVAGVGAARVVSLWDGPGSVKLIIVDADRHPATPTLVSDVADYIETLRPIGAAVTVVSATALAIYVAASVTLAAGYSLADVQEAFEATITEYVKSAAFESTYVSYARIGTLLLGTPGVIDYAVLTVNGGTSNVSLDDDQVPTVGTVELEV